MLFRYQESDLEYLGLIRKRSRHQGLSVSNVIKASLKLSCLCTRTEGPVGHLLPSLPTLTSSVMKIVPDTWQLLNKDLGTGRITKKRGTFPTLEQVSLRLTPRQGQAESLPKWKVRDGL